MEPLAWIILIFLLAALAVDIWADLLNLETLRLKLPPAFSRWYDEARYAASQRYLRTQTRFGWVVTGFDLALLLVFWFAGGFGALDRWVRALDWPVVAQGLIYIGILVAVKGLLGLPFGMYATFVIETRFGFNRTTWRTYVKDRIKGMILTGLVGGGLLALVLAFFQYAGGQAWWACWLATTAVMLVLQYIAPTWIMPLFNRFEPLPEGELRDAVMAYARRIDFKIDGIWVMDGSRRSAKSNAFFTGFGRHRRIVLFDTLIEKHSVAELVAVLAHEMGHYKRRHIVRNLVIGIVHTGVLFFVLSLFISRPALFAAFRVDQISVYAGLIFFGICYSPLDGALGIALHAMSRRHEYEADRYCVDTCEDGEAMITALKNLAVDNLSNLRPHPFYVFLHYSHPPILQRIEAIERRMAENRLSAGPSAGRTSAA